MSVAALVHLMCEKYSWTLEYVLNLTRPQIRALIKGQLEIADIKKEVQSGRKSGATVKYTKAGKIVTEEKSANDIFTLASLPGVKITERAQKLMDRILRKKAERMKDANTG
jgi:hypothetical protein